MTTYNEAKLEAYDYYDTHISTLPRNSDGSYNEALMHNTAVDAFKHAYASAVFAMESYSILSNILGIANEIAGDILNGQPVREQGMDFWNNAAGRHYGIIPNTNKQQIAENISDALDRGELIIDPYDDDRVYIGVELCKNTDCTTTAPDNALLEVFNMALDIPQAFTTYKNILRIVSSVPIEQVAADLNMSLAQLYARANNAYLADRAIELPNGYNMYLFKVGDKVNITPVDNDATYEAVYYDPQADNPDGANYNNYWGNLLVDITGSSKTAKQALEQTPITAKINHAEVKSGTATTHYDGYNFDANDAVQKLGGSLNTNDYAKVTGGSGSYVKEGVNTVIGGITYAVDKILTSVETAASELGNFVVKQASDFGEWFFNEQNFYDYFSTFLNLNKDAIANGDMDAEEAFIEFVKVVAYSRMVDIVQPTLNDAKWALTDYLVDEANMDADRAFNISNTVASTFTQIAFTYAFASNGWDGDDYLKAGLTIATANIANHALQSYFQIPVTPGGSAAISTVVGSLINDQELDDTDLLNAGLSIATGVNVANFDGNGLEIALNIYFEQQAIAASMLANFFLPGSGAVVYAVVKVLQGVLVNSVYQGKVFHEGEYGDPSLVLNSIYQVQQITVNGQQVDALVAVNSNGSTVIAQGITHVIGGTGSDTLVGNATGDDTISGGNGADYLEGRGGEDALIGGSGNDHLNGGDDADILQGDAGDDLLFGEGADDIIIAGDDDDFVHGGGGVDTIAGGSGKDDLLGGPGDDAISGDAGDDTIDGGEGNDSIAGGTENDIILGNIGNDSINGDNGFDIIFGDTGNDTLYGGNDHDFLGGGDGADIINGDNGNDIITGNNDDDFADGGLGDDSILGGAGNDTILGGMDDDYISGEDGNDILQGGFGNDTLIAGTGEDILEGGDGDDIYVISDDTDDENNAVTDTDGDDTLLLPWMSEANANADLDLVQNGDDLEVSYLGRNLATITNHFIGNGKIERIELSNSKYINLASVSYNSGTGIGAFSIATLSTGAVADEVESKTQSVSESIQSKGLYWNDTYLDRLSEVAYDEQLGAGLGNTYYNGTEVIATYRNRGKFGGKYTVYKLDQPGNMTGTDENGSYSGDDMLVGAYWDETFTGKSGDDVLVANSGNDTLYGDSGDDWLFGGDGNDTAQGGTAGDVLSGGNGNDTLNGNDGEDAVMGGDGDDTITGDEGNDWIDSGDGIDDVNGGNGNDIIIGGDGNDIILGGAGADILHGDDGDDDVQGGDGNDVIYGGMGNDTLNGGNGDDIIDGGGGASTLQGGDGTDRLSFRSSSVGMTIDVAEIFSTNGASIGKDLISIEAIGGTNYVDTINGDLNNPNGLYGYDGNDIIYGGLLADWLVGDGGDDTIHGKAGDDYIAGAAGNDTVYAQDNNDSIFGDIGNDALNGENGNDLINGGDGNDYMAGGWGADTLIGGSGTDTIYGEGDDDVLEGGSGSDNMDGGAGSDTVSYAASSAAVTINIATNAVSGGDAAGDTISNFENINGSNYNDTLTGNSGNNLLQGMDGNDILTGGAGADTLNGGNGIDTANYSTSSTAVNINIRDSIYSSGDAAGDSLTSIENINGSNYNDTITGSSVANVIHGYVGNDSVFLFDGDDTAYGEDGDDSLFGENGNDTLYGDNGNDGLFGGNNEDTLYGGAGNDSMWGEGGLDTLTGGSGADIFVFSSLTHSTTSARDIISDFVHGTDKISISSVIATSFSGFSITTSGGNTFITDIDSSFSIQITGTPTIDSSDFNFV